jgi:hypothetical protein
MLREVAALLSPPKVMMTMSRDEDVTAAPANAKRVSALLREARRVGPPQR